MKQVYFKLKFLFIIGFLFLQTTITSAQCVTGTEFDISTPKRDVRGVFLPSIFSLNWPTDRFATPALQQAELIAILDDVQANGYNSIFLQVRPESDALYASTIEPWSKWLTGTQGSAPTPLWDPLTFAVNEAHARGLDLHAWLNPYRAQNGTYTPAANHVITQHPDWIFAAANNANLKLLDPGLPLVRDHIVAVVQDISTRYDVDGIHFDDYFYPSSGMTAAPANQDAQTFIDHNPTNIASLEDWRRNNVNLMIEMVYDAIQSVNSSNNKSITFGVSPFGIWQSGTPTGISGTSSYSALFCDPIAWMSADKIDYIAPQLYWEITGPQDYNSLSDWWNDQAKLYNKQLYVSQAYYKMDNASNWPMAEIQNQVVLNRASTMDATFGQIAYSYTAIKDNLKGLNGALNAAEFQYKSFAPPITGTGKDNICPIKPANVRFGALKILWDTPVAASDGDLPTKYVVYAFDTAAEALTHMNNGAKIIDIVAGNEVDITQSQMDNKFFVVTSLDKNNNEAGDFAAGNTLGISVPTYQKFAIYHLPFNNELNIILPNSYAANSISIQLFDIMGRQVYNRKHVVQNRKILIQDLSKYSAGSYFLYLLDDRHNVIHKKHIIKRTN